jgi:aryl-alcohol dehydrogenase-like predicted oxidoreductase
LAEKLDTTLPRLGYAFLYRQPHVASVIVGPRTIEHLGEALAALELKLDDATMKRIDELVPPGSAPDYVGW